MPPEAPPTSPGRGEDHRHWRLVRAQTSRELVAEHNLKRQGFEVFLPKRRKTVRHARSIKIALGAYFPGYLFVRLDLGRERWRAINGTIGVVGLVGGDRPTPIPIGVVEALMAAADTGAIIQGPLFSIGDEVRVIAGPFADQLATIDRLDDAERVRILLDIVGRRTPVRVERSFLEPVAR